MSNSRITLYEAVQECEAPKPVIIGALSKAGLLEQYRQEEKEYGYVEIKPSTTRNTLKKLIKDFKG